jgi:hypothetical protein
MLIKELYKSDDLEFNCMINNKIKNKRKNYEYIFAYWIYIQNFINKIILYLLFLLFKYSHNKFCFKK